MLGLYNVVVVIVVVSLLSIQVDAAQCNAGVYLFKTKAWANGYVGKLYMDQSWLTNPTSDWKLMINFASEVAEFKVWDADIVNPAPDPSNKEAVHNVTSVEVMNKCWNPILYSCQYLELHLLVRFPEGNVDKTTTNYDVISVREEVTYEDETTGAMDYCQPMSGQPTGAPTTASIPTTA